MSPTTWTGRSNPYSTRFVRPGAIEYVFPEGVSAHSLLGRLEASAWHGAVVGPHGSGKSTLLATLRSPLQRRGRKVEAFTLRAGERRLPLDRATMDTWDAQTQVVVDGYEQLGRRARIRLHSACRRARCGLLATSHRPLWWPWLPTLIVTETTLPLAMRVIARIDASGRLAVSPPALAQLLADRNGDLREVLFDLYDLYQLQDS
jgi:hypothetical protein